MHTKVETASDFVADRVRELRKDRNWKPADLAARCQELGYDISEYMIKDIESGRRKDGRRTRKVTVDEIYPLSRALECSPMDLMPSADAEPGTLGHIPGKSIQELLDAARTVLAFAEQLRSGTET